MKGRMHVHACIALLPNSIPGWNQACQNRLRDEHRMRRIESQEEVGRALPEFGLIDHPRHQSSAASEPS